MFTQRCNLIKINLKRYYYLLIVFSLNLYTQDYVWTGNGTDSNFFNEENWVDVTTSQPPSVGSLEPSQVIYKDLSISCIVNAETSNETDIASQTPAIFDNSQSQTWPYVISAATANDGIISQLTQSVEISVTFYLP